MSLNFREHLLGILRYQSKGKPLDERIEKLFRKVQNRDGIHISVADSDNGS